MYSQRARHAIASRTERFTTCSATIGTNGGAAGDAATIAVISEMNSAAAAATRAGATPRGCPSRAAPAARGAEPALPATKIQAIAKTLGAADAINATVAHGDPPAAAQTVTMTAVAITAATCSASARVTSATVLAHSVSTASVPKSGQGGMPHSGFIATKSRKRWPIKPRYRPSRKPGSVPPAAGADWRCAHAYPPSVTSVMPATTASDGMTPTLDAARIHHVARIAHEKIVPANDTTGRPPPALSRNTPAFRIASSSASAQIACGATEPAARNRSSGRLASSTSPLPAAGSSGRPARRASNGTLSDTMPNAL